MEGGEGGLLAGLYQILVWLEGVVGWLDVIWLLRIEGRKGRVICGGLDEGD